MNTDNKPAPVVTLEQLVAQDTKTAARPLAVQSGVRAGGDPVVYGKFAKYR